MSDLQFALLHIVGKTAIPLAMGAVTVDESRAGGQDLIFRRLTRRRASFNGFEGLWVGVIRWLVVHRVSFRFLRGGQYFTWSPLFFGRNGQTKRHHPLVRALCDQHHEWVATRAAARIRTTRSLTVAVIESSPGVYCGQILKTA